MACPVCPVAGWFGGWIGGYFGVSTPEKFEGKVLSATLTASLVALTILGTGISLCIDGKMTLDNFAVVGVKAFGLGIIYSIGVNSLINRYVYPPSCSGQEEKGNSHCCCTKKKE